ncbi:MAG: hypothetical protein A3D59_01175 [Candidatus Wildermuthbacteria bacterium RIFCSPHIGHO2_02_FULL_47_17]|uniref:Methyltransferase type 11 domain-containing protein n=1 Tax=Candidatus Wildermuthbacteria bacterium RIFCSPHIGHO2_02_FULL_47_17 TaxID=1802452 RepID=A0A1G2R7C5_9BACT|nr:MAG: hypothetical protein A3D59_01175 [Candidatus Wildermuthbacteria bacterium RIFCSPHIGHO2_02_FULL_47_17]
MIYPSTVNFGKDLNAKIFSARRLPDRIHGTIVKCSRCGLVRTYEVIDDSQLSKLYVNSRFTYKNLTNNLRTSYGIILQEAVKYFGRRNSFLEIGCGNGFMLEEALKIGFGKVSGIEPSRDAISRADKRIRSFIKQDILHQGVFPKNSFDMIAAFQVFDHIPNPNHFLKICLTLLRPKGILVLMNHDVESLSARVLGERSPIIDIEHTYLYSQKTIGKILRKNDYKVAKIYNPPAIFSIKYFLRLLPLPQSFKKVVEKSKSKLLDTNIRIKPGNLCAISIKK